MTGSKLLENLQTWLIVTVISVVVWLYAEGEAVSERTERVQVKFVSPPGRNLAIEPGEGINPESVLVTVTFRASAGQMGQVRHILSQGPVEIAVNDPPTDAPLEQLVLFQEELMAQTRLGELGVNITKTEPDRLELLIEPLKTVELDVTVQTGDLRTAGPPTPDPVKVPVTLPARLVEQASNVRAIARLNDYDLSQFAVNESHRLPAVSLRLPEPLQRPWVTLGRDTVAVEFVISKQTDTTTLNLVPIHISAPPLLFQQFDIALNDAQRVLHDVRLSGPADVIREIRDRELRVVAELRPPNTDDLSPGEQEWPVYLNVPSTVTVESALPQVPVTVTRRE